MIVRSPGRTRVRSLIAVAVLVLTAAVPSGVGRATEPNGAAGARLLAETLGGAPNDFALVHERSGDPTGASSWSGKYIDARTGAVHAVYLDAATGTLTTLEPDPAAFGAVAAESALDVKGDDELRAAVGAAADAAPDAAGARSMTAVTPEDAMIAVGVWLAVDTAAAEAAVMARHPELTWDGGRPLVADLGTARAIRAELAAAQADARAAAFAQFAADVASLGGTVAYESSNAPLAYVDVPASAVEALAALPSVSSIGLERTWTPSMATAGAAVQANWTGGGADQGAGVRVAVVEYHNVRNTGDLAGRVVASYSTSGALAYTAGEFDHPTWVAGAIASQNGTYTGVAPGALIVSASTGGGGASVARDRNIIAAADWAANAGGGDADIVNASIGQDTATGSEEARRYFDALVHEQGRLAVAAAGNYTTFGHWDIVSPGTAYNVLTVGGIDDRGTAGRGDDRIWYYPGSNGSNHRDPAGTAWNPHGDFNKPNVSAPAPGVRTANGLTASGTSVASPIVAGIAAQLIANAPSLALRPEGTRAIIMAGAINRTPMPDGSLNADHEGTGTASALWSNRILNGGDGAWGGHRLASMTPGQVLTQEIKVVSGQLVRVALAWNSHTSGSSISTRSDRLMADLDLRIVQPDGSVVGSFTFDNNYEWVDFVPRWTGTARIEVRATRFEAASERIGLAWVKTSPFNDIESSPFFSDIVWVAQEGITIGCGGGNFCPTSPVKREQMASFLVRALRLPPTSTDHFDDDSGSGHQADINALAQSGITLGCGHRRFCPSEDVSREQMASFLVRALRVPPNGTNRFWDDNGSIHEADINALAASGITHGCGGGAYCPRVTVSREQMAAFLHRALGD